jgi:hypothetical protein
MTKRMRIAVSSLAGSAALFGGLAAAEQVGTPVASHPHLVPVTKTVSSTSTSNGNLDHCTDGHGQDGVHNPHCRAASGG